MAFKTNWAIGNTGHVAEHNIIGTRLNASVCAADDGVSASASAATNNAGIAAAIARAVALGGGVVLLPPGTLPVSVAISIPNNVTLCGSGMNATKLRADAAISGGLVQLIGSAGAHRQYAGVEHLSLYCNSNTDDGVELDYAIYTCSVRHVFITGAVVAGIHSNQYNSFGCLFDFLTVYQCVRGVWFEIGANAMRVLNSNIRENAKAGLYMDTPAACLIQGTTFEKNGTSGIEQAGIILHGGNCNTIHSCYFEGNGLGDGVDIQVESSATNTPHGSVISGCYFNGLDTQTDHAVTTDEADIVMIGGQSTRHTGKTLIETTGGTVTDIGVSSLDSAGLR